MHTHERDVYILPEFEHKYVVVCSVYSEIVIVHMHNGMRIKSNVYS